MIRSLRMQPNRKLYFKELPMPPTPGPGEVQVRMAFASICGYDMMMLRGTAAYPLNGYLGHEGSGVVTAVGENVRALRREKHLSQEELSEMVFTTQKYISCIEMGRAHPSLEACLRIADALHVSIDTLLKGIIETGSEVLKPNSPEQDLLDNVIWVVHRYLENR